MILHNLTYRITILLLTAIFLLFESAVALESRETRTIIDNFMFGYSPRSAAMGFCSVNLVDGQSAFHNPAAMGLYHLNKIMSTNLVAYPKFGYSYDRLYNFGISVRIPYISDYLKSVENFKYSISLGYSTSRMNYKPWALSSHMWFERSNYYSFGLGFEYFARLGFGYMYSDVKTTFEGAFPEYPKTRVRSAAHDYGLIVGLPVIKTLSLVTDRDFSYQELDFELTPSYAYVWSNIDGNPRVADRFDNAGVSITGEISYDQIPLSSLMLIMEKERYIGENDYGNFNTDKVGYEFCFGGFLFLRWGNYVNDLIYLDYEGQTEGIGFSSKGISNWLYSFETIEDKGRVSDWILNNVDITIDVSDFDWGLGRSLRTSILNICISF